MKKRYVAVTLACVMMLSLLAGCGSKGAGKGSTGGELTKRAKNNEVTIGIAQDFDSLDPDHMTAAGTKEVMFNVYEGLVKPDSNGDIIPAVASEVEKSDDGLTYTFTLRKDVKFHNDAKVTMDDVVYSIERRWKGEDKAAYLESLNVIKELKKDGDKLSIVLSEPNNEFLASVMNAYIIPAGYKDLETAPVGTGPYKFVSRSAQENLVLKRFDGYWGTPGNIDKVTYRILEDANSLIMGLQSGALDLVSHLSSDQIMQLNKNDFTIEEGSMNLVQALYLNNKEKPFDDVRVRQALCLAIDKQEVIDTTFDGYGTPLGTSMIPSFGKYYDDSLTDYYKKDIKKAKKLLKDAGYAKGFKMTITVPSNYTPHVNTGTVLVEMLQEIGVKAEIKPVDWATWLDQVYENRKYQSTVIGLTPDNLTARTFLERFGSKQDKNFINYSDKDYDKILKKALKETDDEEQIKLYKQLEENMTRNAASVFLQDMADLVAVRKGLKGLTFYPLYVLDVSTLSWSK